MAAYEVLLLNTAIPQIQAAQSGDTYVVPRDIAFSAALTLTAGTANGVPYLNASKVLTTGSALTFDGTNLGVGTASPDIFGRFYTRTIGFTSGGSTVLQINGGSYGGIDIGAAGTRTLGLTASGTDVNLTTLTNIPLLFGVNGSEQMRLTSTGLGIGTTNPVTKLQVGSVGSTGASAATNQLFADYSTAAQLRVMFNNTGNYIGIGTDGGANLILGTSAANAGTSPTALATLTSSGNLGLGQVPAVRKFEINAIPASISQLNGIRMQMDGAATSASEFLLGTDSGGVPYTSIRTGNDGNSYMNFLVGSGPTERMRISSDGTFRVKGAGTAGSTDAVQFSGSAPASAMTLDASGNFGIGTGSPAQKLTVNGDALVGTNLFIGNGAGSMVGATAPSLYSPASATLGISVGGAERVRITSGGDFLVGKNSASPTTLGVEARANGFISSTLAGSTSATDTLEVYSTGAAAFRFYVTMDGTVYATNTTISAISDQRLKENIRDLDAGLNAVLALKPRKFDWKTGKGKDKKDDRGFIAQEFEQVFPDLIDEWKDPAPEGEEPYKSVRADLIPVLVKAIQEQQTMINELKAEVAALKGA